MTVTVTLTFATPDEAALFLAGQRQPVEVKMPPAPEKATKQKDAAAQVEKPATASPSAAPATAPAQPTTTAPSPAPQSAPPSEVGTPNYNDIRARVLAMAKISQDTALGVLKQFTGVNGQPVDHGNKLQLPDYPAFIAKADEVLKAAGVAA